MKEGRQRIFPVHFDPGKRLFHIVVRLSDAPGSYSSVLEILRQKLNLIGTTTYTLSDGTAMFSGFAEALSPKETVKGLQKLIQKSDAAIEVLVNEGKDGLLVDTFHTGFNVGGEDYMLWRRAGLAHMFDSVSKMLGSGGEALLYEEGVVISKWNAKKMAKDIGAERVKSNVGSLNRFLAAQGWGIIGAKDGQRGGEFNVVLNDCFECSGGGSSRLGCNFMRGYLKGAAMTTYGTDYESTEMKCVLKGAKACEFRLTPMKKVSKV